MGLFNVVVFSYSNINNNNNLFYNNNSRGVCCLCFFLSSFGYKARIC